jgi:hypothetical protein
MPRDELFGFARVDEDRIARLEQFGEFVRFYQNPVGHRLTSARLLFGDHFGASGLLIEASLAPTIEGETETNTRTPPNGPMLSASSTTIAPAAKRYGPRFV